MIGLDGEVFAAGRSSLRFHRLASSGGLNLYNSWGLSRLCYLKSSFDSGFLSASNYLHIPRTFNPFSHSVSRVPHQFSRSCSAVNDGPF